MLNITTTVRIHTVKDDLDYLKVMTCIAYLNLITTITLCRAGFYIVEINYR